MEDYTKVALSSYILGIVSTLLGSNFITNPGRNQDEFTLIGWSIFIVSFILAITLKKYFVFRYYLRGVFLTFLVSMIIYSIIN